MKKILILLAVGFFTSACSAYYSGYYDDYDSRSGWYGSYHDRYYGQYHDGYRHDRDHDWNRDDRQNHGDRERGDNRDQGDQDRDRDQADRNHQARNFGDEYRR